MELVYLSDDITLKLDSGRCNGCGMCVKVCPRAVLKMNGRKVEIVRKDYCIECGACMINCPKEALSVKAGTGCGQAYINSILKIRSGACNC